jgi:hypothetical protein
VSPLTQPSKNLVQACPLKEGRADGNMTVLCDFCGKGNVKKQPEEIAFSQWSDKGYVYVRVTLMIDVCDHCHAKSRDPGVDEILDEAFQREYDKLPKGKG